MTSILMIIGVFAGVAICMATLYSVAQAMMREGALRRAHAVAVIAVLAVMGALLEREVALARMLAVPLLGVAVWVFVVERGWYRIFPVMMQLFAGLLIAGYVALTPLPA
ncbi:hypothetical protein LNKW23_04120 [Paralimibaculum aggregatum]|uniref:DUF3325 domain-containing protein n=1 Tax=Paralimibaculum aggregatum TaxID=3036245 RepID=A0ABQ6LG65_9RHOB|nr:hypothetical protein [Limibaculum sp. NKW23]GMG81200.1 hypothetical protein LNKW23_04120 [Limibaculum sp. NKW23]